MGGVYLLVWKLSNFVQSVIMHQLPPMCPDCLHISERTAADASRSYGGEKKRHAALFDMENHRRRVIIHMLIVATYIWYSSIASTNCPHESKSVPFLKLACHFWIVLLTSDIFTGRSQVSIADSINVNVCSSKLRPLQHRRLPGYVLSGGTQRNRWHPDQALLPAHPNIASVSQRKSRLSGVRTFWKTGSPELKPIQRILHNFIISLHCLWRCPVLALRYRRVKFTVIFFKQQTEAMTLDLMH